MTTREDKKRGDEGVRGGMGGGGIGRKNKKER